MNYFNTLYVYSLIYASNMATKIKLYQITMVYVSRDELIFLQTVKRQQLSKLLYKLST